MHSSTLNHHRYNKWNILLKMFTYNASVNGLHLRWYVLHNNRGGLFHTLDFLCSVCWAETISRLHIDTYHRVLLCIMIISAFKCHIWCYLNHYCRIRNLVNITSTLEVLLLHFIATQIICAQKLQICVFLQHTCRRVLTLDRMKCIKYVQMFYAWNHFPAWKAHIHLWDVWMDR